EPVHVRHVDVEQDRGEILHEEVPQGVQPRFRGDDADAQRLQRDRQRQPLIRQVVDNQDVDFVVGHKRSMSGGREGVLLLAARNPTFPPWYVSTTHRAPLTTHHSIGVASPAALPRAGPCPPAWTNNPMHQPRYTSRGRLSWPSPSRR